MARKKVKKSGDAAPLTPEEEARRQFQKEAQQLTIKLRKEGKT